MADEPGYRDLLASRSDTTSVREAGRSDAEVSS